MRLSRNPKQTGFTLVELLVVISIITVLAALLVPAVYYSIQTAKRARVGLEIANISKALESYKQAYGEYPPDFSEMGEYATQPELLRAAIAMGIINDHLARNFRRRDIMLDWPREANGNITQNSVNFLANLNPTNALAFWLRGFSPDPTAPLFGGGTREAFFDFDQSRLNMDASIMAVSGLDYDDIKLLDASNYVAAAPYYPSGGLDNRPYIYYRANYNTTLSTYSPLNPALASTAGSYSGELASAFAALGGGNALSPSASEPYRGYVGPALWAYLVNQNNIELPGAFTVPSPYFSYQPTTADVARNNPLNSSPRNTISTLYPYAAPKKFQLISAGLDGMFGVGGDWGSGLGNALVHQYNVADNDNLTSFSSGRALEDLKDE